MATKKPSSTNDDTNKWGVNYGDFNGNTYNCGACGGITDKKLDVLAKSPELAVMESLMGKQGIRTMCLECWLSHVFQNLDSHGLDIYGLVGLLAKRWVAKAGNKTCNSEQRIKDFLARLRKERESEVIR